MSVPVNCWFCNGNTRVPAALSNSWHCPQCDQYNGFSDDGDYNVPLPAQLSCGASAGHVRYNVAPPPATSGAGDGDSLCVTCAQQQALKVRLLADFEPQRPENYEAELAAYRRRLERLHALCVACERRVSRRLEEQDERLRPAVAAWRAGRLLTNGPLSAPSLGSPSGAATAGASVLGARCRRRGGGVWRRWRGVLWLALHTVTCACLAAAATSGGRLDLCCQAVWALAAPVQLLSLLHPLLCDPQLRIHVTVALLAAGCAVSVAGARRGRAVSVPAIVWLQVWLLQLASYSQLLTHGSAASGQLLLLLLLVPAPALARRCRKRLSGAAGRVASASVLPRDSWQPCPAVPAAVPAAPSSAELSAVSALTSLNLSENGAATSTVYPRGLAPAVFGTRRYQAPPPAPSPLLAPSKLSAVPSASSDWASCWQDSCDMDVSPVKGYCDGVGGTRAPSRQSSGFGDWPAPLDDAASHYSDSCLSHRGGGGGGSCVSRRLNSSCGALSSCSSTWSCDSGAARAADGWRPLLVALVLGFSLAFNVFMLLFSGRRSSSSPLSD